MLNIHKYKSGKLAQEIKNSSFTNLLSYGLLKWKDETQGIHIHNTGLPQEHKYGFPKESCRVSGWMEFAKWENTYRND